MPRFSVTPNRSAPMPIVRVHLVWSFCSAFPLHVDSRILSRSSSNRCQSFLLAAGHFTRRSALRRGWCCLEVLGTVVWPSSSSVCTGSATGTPETEVLATAPVRCCIHPGHLCLMDLQTCRVFANLAADTFCAHCRLSACLGHSLKVCPVGILILPPSRESLRGIFRRVFS